MFLTFFATLFGSSHSTKNNTATYKTIDEEEAYEIAEDVVGDEKWEAQCQAECDGDAWHSECDCVGGECEEDCDGF